MIITIDGPSASGKSTISRLLAQQLGFYYINTGMLFRAIAYVLLNKKDIKLEQLSLLTAKEFIDLINISDLAYCYYPQGTVTVSYQHEDITLLLKNATIDKASSILGTNAGARTFLIHYERSLAQCHNVVIEGRDCGSIIFPDAQVKFFLIADIAERARRWQHDQQQKGAHICLEEAIRLISERDERDTMRAIAPLIKPTDAIVVDNTKMTIQETLGKMLNMIKEKMT